MQTRLNLSLRWNLALIPLLGLIVGCAEQPYGYVFTPTGRDQLNVARLSISFLGELYDHADEAAGYLNSAGLTTSNNYRSILPDGWVDSTSYDTNGLPQAPMFTFYRNFLDKQYSALGIPVTPTPGAVRNPARLMYAYTEIASALNRVTNEFYGQAKISRRFDVYYADSYTNPDFVEGWFSIRKIEMFEQEIEIGGSNQSYQIPLSVPWAMKVERFSVDRADQRGHIIIDGIFPIMDETGIIQQTHISGVFNVAADGTGTGEVSLFGEKCARITLTGRSFGFKAKFTMYNEDHKFTYNN